MQRRQDLPAQLANTRPSGFWARRPLLEDLVFSLTLPPTAWGFRRKFMQRNKTKCEVLSESAAKSVSGLS